MSFLPGRLDTLLLRKNSWPDFLPGFALAIRPGRLDHPGRLGSHPNCRPRARRCCILICRLFSTTWGPGMKKPYGTVTRADARHSDHVTKALNELASQSDRSAAMVATAILDLVLTEALKSYLHTDTNIAAHFFAADGPVGDLGAKVDLAFLVGLVSETSWRDLRELLRPPGLTGQS